MGLDHQESENRGDKRYEDGDIEKYDIPSMLRGKIDGKDPIGKMK